MSAMFRIFRRHMCLPGEALAQLRSLLDSYDRLRASAPPVRTGSDDIVDKLKDRLNIDAAALWWSDFEAAELCVVAVLPDDDLRSRIVSWRVQFQQVVGDGIYAQYIATAPALAVMTGSQLRADLSQCIREVYYYYGAYGVAARSRSSVTKALLLVALCVLAVLGGSLILANMPSIQHLFWTDKTVPSGTIKMVSWSIGMCAAGVLGSVVSVQRRLHDPNVNVDPYYRYVQTTADWFGIAFVSPIFGAIFGLLIYGMIVAKLIASGIVEITNGFPAASKDIAGLLILGFLAGFAEQLVPDTLTRIAARALNGVAASDPPPRVNGGGGSVAIASSGPNGPNSGPGAQAVTQDTSQLTDTTKQREPARLSRVPADITDGARDLGQNASLASQPIPANPARGLIG